MHSTVVIGYDQSPSGDRALDLIVAGAHRRGDGHLGMRPGPIVHTLLHHADCPVVVVPRT